MQILSFDASFNPHDYVLLSDHCISHEGLLLSHLVLMLHYMYMYKSSQKSWCRSGLRPKFQQPQKDSDKVTLLSKQYSEKLVHTLIFSKQEKRFYPECHNPFAIHKSIISIQIAIGCVWRNRSEFSITEPTVLFLSTTLQCWCNLVGKLNVHKSLIWLTVTSISSHQCCQEGHQKSQLVLWNVAKSH